jgi:hypothetical protein
LKRIAILWLGLAVAMMAAPPNAEQLKEQIALITEITGLEARKQVPVETLSREAWKAWVDEQVKEQSKPEEIRRDEILLKMFGLVPRDFDLRKTTVDLLGEQAAAVYDHRRKRMIFVEGAETAGMEESVLIHELSHAVADQHFDMGRFLDKGPKSDEQQFARLAVVEGQAMWIMAEAMLKRMGQTLAGNGKALESMLPAMGQMAASQYPVFSGAPLYMRETLLFPYSGGMVFQQAVVDRMGKAAFREVLRNPPVSTQQILHPDKYFAGAKPSAVTLPPAPARGYKRWSMGDLGEFDLLLLLREGGMEEQAARRLSAGWRGGAYELMESREGKRPLLRWALALDGEESAAAVLAGYRQLLEKKAGGARFAPTEPFEAVGQNGDGAFRVERRGRTLSAVEGLQ